jgi:uncharacterized protein YebE (UPF0316 family)
MSFPNGERDGYKPTVTAQLCPLWQTILPKAFNVTEAGKAVHGECWLAKVNERKSQQH